MNDLPRGQCGRLRDDPPVALLTFCLSKSLDMLNVNRRGKVSNRTSEVLQGTLDLMVLKTLESMGTLHGYRIARRIEEVSANSLTLNQGTIYPALLRLQQKGWISARWGVSETGRRARFYSLTRAGRKQIEKEIENWDRIATTMAHFLAPSR